MTKNFEKLINNWDDIILKMKEEFDISDFVFNAFIKEPLNPIKMEKDILYIEVPEEQYINYLNNRFLLPLRITITNALGIKSIDDLNISFITKKQTSKKNKITDEESFDKTLIRLNIEKKNTFENFVKGESNNLAYATSIAVSEDPGSNYNPLYIYGATGLGKTHLLHAIAQHSLKKFENFKVIYTSCQNFANEFYVALKDKKVDTDFKEKYFNVDMILIDDIQFLNKQEELQKIFFNIFNNLYSEKKQIVLTSDKQSKDLEGIQERLLSRFSWGISCDMKMPDYETRIAILRKKEEEIKPEFPVDMEVVKYIAKNVKTNIRELEGCLTKIILKSRLEKKSVDIESAKEILIELEKEENEKITPEKIMQTVSEYFGISILDMSGVKRNREFVYARDIAIYICRDLIKDITQVKIGKLFGGRDHSTIINCCKRVEQKLLLEKELRENIENIKKKLIYS